MTSKRPSLKERVFEKLGTSRFRSSTEDLHKSDAENDTTETNSEGKKANTIWYAHPAEQVDGGNSGTRPQPVNLEPLKPDILIDNAAKKEKKKIRPPGTKEYSVRETDTLSSIAAFYDTTPSTLTKLNKLTTRYIYPGQILYVPDPDSDEEDAGINVLDSSLLSSSPERPTMDVPLIKMADRPPSKIPGHVERIPTPVSSPTKTAEFVAPSKLTEEEVELLDQECYERFIKVNVKHITDGQGVVSGVLLVTPNAVMFDPNVSDPLVIEHGAENYGVIAPMDMVVSAAMYHDIAAAMRVRGQRDLDGNIANCEVYHNTTCPLYKSWCEGHRVKSHTDLKRVKHHVKSDENATVSSPQSENDSICSCSANQSVASPESSNHSNAVFETANQNGTSDIGDKLNSKPMEYTEFDSAGPIEMTPANEFGDFVSAFTSEENHGQTDSLLTKHLSDSDQLASAGQEIVQTESESRFTGDVSFEDSGQNDQQVPKDNKMCDNSESMMNQDCESAATAQSKDIPQTETTDCDEKQKMRIGNIVYLPVTEGTKGKVSLKDLESAQSTLSKLSFDEFEQKSRSHSSPLDIPLVKTSDKNSAQENRTSGSLGSFNMTPHLSAFVNYASGLFKTSASVKDMNDVLQDGSEQEGNSENSSDSKFDLKPVSIGASKDRKLQSGKDSHTDSKSDLEVAVENAVKLADKPELFQSFDKLIPKPAANFEDPPLYLSLRLGTPINKNVSQTCPIQAYSRKKKKPEYWFSIPRDKVDQLYAFFVQWKPEIYGDDEEMSAEKRGFVILDENEKEPEEMTEIYDEYFNNAIQSLQKDWEIISTEEAMRRKSVDVDDIIVVPELIGQSAIMNDYHLQMINKHMPARTVGYPWTLIYSTDLHGFSLKTLYRAMASIDSPSLLTVKDSNDIVFGAMTSCKLRPSDHFYGTGESFLFTFYPEFKIFRWTGENNFFNKGNQESLSIGAGQGQFGLWFDGDLYHGRTKRCETYDNDVLTLSEDFVVKTFEAWVFVQD